ncbi:MAG TPA: radical SAM protein [Elusimicrobiota bacterium]|nr:radical SAM protein [Elusimicrobiota bacterium]
MKVALVQAPYGYRGREAPPFSVVCLAGYVRHHGHAPLSIDFGNALYHASSPDSRVMWNADRYSFWENPDAIERLLHETRGTTDALIRRILESGARVIGFATHTTSFLASLALAERIKREDPSRLIVFGGYQCAREKSGLAFAADWRVDGVAVGEGEQTLVEALAGVERTGRLPAIPGLLVRGEDGRVVDSGDREPIMDMDSMPFPDYSDFREDIRAGLYSDPRRLDVFDGRSCVRRCAFCNEWQFWGRFRSRSGRRILEEIRHQMSEHPTINHFYFTGLLVNGNLRELSRFCDLVLESGLKFTWGGQSIVQPGMDEKMLKKMAAAGCRWLGYGVESGSEAVRWRINKKFTNENAYKTLRATAEAGIKAQINVMFGMPSETRDEFQETLSFLTRVRPYLDSILASQSFCVIDKDTPLHRNPERYGITNQDHHLFWESNGGENNYAERFRRYEEFCKLALFLGVPETSGVLSRKPDKWFLLGSYYEYKKQPLKAVLYLRRSLLHEIVGKDTLTRLAGLYAQLRHPARAWALLQAALSLTPEGAADAGDDSLRVRRDALFPSVQDKSLAMIWLRRRPWGRALRLKEADSVAAERNGTGEAARRAANIALNGDEFNGRKEVLSSTPSLVTLGTHNACNAKCVFCLEGSYSRFSLDIYKKFFEAKMGHFIRQADRVTFTGFGEILWIPGIEEFLDYINETLPDAEKIFTTNGTPLRPSVLERIAKGKYGIQISLHASHAALHQELTLLNGQFGQILENIRSLSALRQRPGLDKRIFVHLVNVLTRRNIDDLTDFIRMSVDLGVQSVRCQHVTMFVPEHIEQSCFFDQERANASIRRAATLVEAIKLKHPKTTFIASLPPLFGSRAQLQNTVCYDPWQHVYVELQGSVIPCCMWGDHIGNLNKGDDIDKVWNSRFYQDLRRGMASGDPHPWCKSCVRYAGYNVDSIFCHITNRPEAQKAVLREVLRRGLPLEKSDKAAAAKMLGKNMPAGSGVLAA